MLDIEEYFHLALNAAAKGDHYACMAHVHEVLAREPRHARALYLRAVQHAEIGLTDRAISGIEAALLIEPGLEVARLQLAMLLLVDGKRAAAARQHLAKLERSADSAVRTCSEALTAVADDDLTLAEEKLVGGLGRARRIHEQQTMQPKTEHCS